MDLASFELLFTPLGSKALDFAQQLQPREEDYLRHFPHQSN